MKRWVIQEGSKKAKHVPYGDNYILIGSGVSCKIISGTRVFDKIHEAEEALNGDLTRWVVAGDKGSNLRVVRVKLLSALTWRTNLILDEPSRNIPRVWINRFTHSAGLAGDGKKYRIVSHRWREPPSSDRIFKSEAAAKRALKKIMARDLKEMEAEQKRRQKSILETRKALKKAA